MFIFCEMFVATNFCGHPYLAKKTGKVDSKTDLSSLLLKKTGLETHLLFRGKISSANDAPNA